MTSRTALTLFLISSFVVFTSAHAQDEDIELAFEDSILIGHNMTPTTETLRAGVFTLGPYALAVGLTDDILLATSPWIWLSYNTANLHLKWAGNITQKDRLGVFVSYFESYESEPLISNNGTSGPGSRPNTPPTNGIPGGPGGGGPGNFTPMATTGYNVMTRYQWKSYSAHLLYSHEFLAGPTTYLSLKYSYFWNDDSPYSLRMDPGADDLPHQWDITTLTHIPFGASGFGMNLELGSVGLTAIYPYAHLGLSIDYKSESWLIGLGASYTIQFREMNQSSGWTPGRYDSRSHISKTDGETYYFRYLQTAMHPEFQLQYFF